MTTPYTSFDHLSDSDILREVTRLAAREREATACLVASLAVLDRRRLYLAEGYGSMFVYCTQCLHLSEASAYKRITVARAAQRFPVILDRLADGAVSLATVSLLAAHLTVENHVALLDEARHRSKREVEEIVARLQPRPDVPNALRKLPVPKSPAPAVYTEASAKPADTTPVDPPSSDLPVSTAPTPDTTCSPTLDTSAVTNARETREQATTSAPRGSVTPLAPARYKLTVTIGAETYEKLRQAQDLLRHTVPNGDLALLLDRALTLLLHDAAKTKLAATDRPRASNGSTSRSRRIPATVRRRVWQRDGGRCAFVSPSGHRCPERGWLEFHHVVPYAKGGHAAAENIQLRCRRHNGYEAERDFGPWAATHVREERPLYGSNPVASEISSDRLENRCSSASLSPTGIVSCRAPARPGESSTRVAVKDQEPDEDLHAQPQAGPRERHRAARRSQVAQPSAGRRRWLPTAWANACGAGAHCPATPPGWRRLVRGTMRNVRTRGSRTWSVRTTIAGSRLFTCTRHAR